MFHYRNTSRLGFICSFATAPAEKLEHKLQHYGGHYCEQSCNQKNSGQSKSRQNNKRGNEQQSVTPKELEIDGLGDFDFLGAGLRGGQRNERTHALLHPSIIQPRKRCSRCEACPSFCAP